MSMRKFVNSIGCEMIVSSDREEYIEDLLKLGWREEKNE